MMFPLLRTACTPLLAKLPMPVFQAIPKMTDVSITDFRMQHRHAYISQRVLKGLKGLKSKKCDFTPMLQGQTDAGKRQGLTISTAELAANGIGSILAGTDTTGLAISVGAWSILSDESIRVRLQAELASAWPSEDQPPSLQDLEKLPFLRACVQESLRFSTPISGRLPRITPKGGFKFAGYKIPPGTQVSSSVYLVHYDEKVFENPHAFTPDRWLSEAPDQYLIPFSTGSRACIGINLALAEIYIGLATLLRSYKARKVFDRKFETSSQFTTSIPGGLKVELTKIDV